MASPTHIVSILIPDAIGIIKRIVTVLQQQSVLHIEISQTLVHGMFTITLVVSVPDDKDTDKLRRRLQDVLGQNASVALQRYHAPAQRQASDERFILTAIGDFSAGLLNAITSLIMDRDGNFTDFSSTIRDGRLQLLAEVDLPKSVALDQLQIDLKHACGPADVAIRLQHSRLFEATNEVAFRRISHA
jgi:predicted amino acid-binding ACT domain protein